MSSNLRNKKYYFRNQQLSKEEYERKMREEIYLGNWTRLQKYCKEYADLKQNARYKPDNNFRAINSFGDWIDNSRNCYWCNYIIECDNIHYSEGVGYYKDSYDIVGGAGGELCYELMTISTTNNFGAKLSSQIDNCRDVEYCDLCRNCHDCFGCVGLSNRSFCILNRQYSEEGYRKLVDEIKTNMLERGEYGEFFPPALMPVPYRISLTSSYPGFRDFEQASSYGYDTTEVSIQKSDVAGDIASADSLPDDIKNVENDILQKIIFDEKNNKYFRITPYELNFYRRFGLVLPREHPLKRLERFREVYDLRMSFYDRNCVACNVPIRSVHNPERYKNVYCEPCYQNSLI